MTCLKHVFICLLVLGGVWGLCWGVLGECFEGVFRGCFGYISEILGDKNDVIHAVSKTNPDKLFASPGKFVPILVKAVQELSAENTALKQRLDAAGL